MIALLVVNVAWATPSAGELQAAWERWRPKLDAHAVYPFRFSEQEWAKLAEGKVVRRRERLAGTDRVLGVVWSPTDLDTTWVAVQDGHGEVVDGFTEILLPGSSFQHKVVFQRIELPWPLAPRQWVIEVTNNRALKSATQDKIWERTWKLSDRRDLAELPKNGVWLDVNEGGWFFAEAGGGTLLGYHVRTVVGGIVPDEVATRWSFSTLAGMLQRVVDRTDWIRGHYIADHEPISRPGETEIPRFEAP
ncbi:MAG TPA: hypothetical protein ENK18_20095 [Deltaproteobacteria bacterium]|nr:hypothetical protein [Deltaproteobacteria bacterium]